MISERAMSRSREQAGKSATHRVVDMNQSPQSSARSPFSELSVDELQKPDSVLCTQYSCLPTVKLIPQKYNVYLVQRSETAPRWTLSDTEEKQSEAQ